FYHPDNMFSYYPAGNYPAPGCASHGPAPPATMCPFPNYELGAFAKNDASDHEVESTYNFLILDAGATGPQGDVVVDAANTSPTAEVINIIAYVDLHKRSG